MRRHLKHIASAATSSQKLFKIMKTFKEAIFQNHEKVETVANIKGQ